MYGSSILSLVASSDGTILPAFAALDADAWAQREMLARYYQVITDDDGPASFPRQCYNKLKEEREALSTWFDSSGRLSPTLQSVFMMNKLSGPVDDGLGWDFRADGKPEHRMITFKGTLLAVWRGSQLIDPVDRHIGNMQFGGLATMVKSAYTERAKLHSWRDTFPYQDDRRYLALDMSSRWVAHQTYLFLLNIGAPERWAWESSNSFRIFGPVDEKRGFT